MNNLTPEQVTDFYKQVETQWLGRAKAQRLGHPLSVAYRKAECEFFIGAMTALSCMFPDDANLTMPPRWVLPPMMSENVVAVPDAKPFEATLWHLLNSASKTVLDGYEVTEIDCECDSDGQVTVILLEAFDGDYRFTAVNEVINLNHFDGEVEITLHHEDGTTTQGDLELYNERILTEEDLL